VPAEIDMAVIDEPRQRGGVTRRVRHWLSANAPLWLEMLVAGQRRCIRILQRFSLPETVEFRLKLRHLQKEKSRLYDLYAASYEECRLSNADDAQIEDLNEQERYDLGIIGEQIYQLYYEKITAQAERCFVSIPDLQQNREQWELATLTGRWRLRREALQDLHTAIRAIKKERHEALQGKLIWVTAVTGMLGVLTGLGSVLNR
jgi:hypothetical protein